jgi:hypothetical protein
LQSWTGHSPNIENTSNFLCNDIYGDSERSVAEEKRDSSASKLGIFLKYFSRYLPKEIVLCIIWFSFVYDFQF